MDYAEARNVAQQLVGFLSRFQEAEKALSMAQNAEQVVAESETRAREAQERAAEAEARQRAAEQAQQEAIERFAQQERERREERIAAERAWKAGFEQRKKEAQERFEQEEEGRQKALGELAEALDALEAERDALKTQIEDAKLFLGRLKEQLKKLTGEGQDG